MQAYLDRHKYYLLSPDAYESALQVAGFVNVKVQDITSQVGSSNKV